MTNTATISKIQKGFDYEYVVPQPKTPMKTIISRKRYDTETATEVANYWNGLSTSDFGYLSETLYQTPKGNWFIAGKGGAFTRYAQSCGNGVCGGRAIRPLEPDQACQWLEEHHQNEALEKYFPAELQDA